MSTTKGRNLGLRLDENDTKDLELFERTTGIEATTLARNALRACIAYWKQHGKISFPLRLVEIDQARNYTLKEMTGSDAAQKAATRLNEIPPATPSDSARLRKKLDSIQQQDSATH